MSTPIQNNSEGLQRILQQINALPDAGSADPVLQSKSATPSETAQMITPDSGYDGLSSVSVGAISKTYVGSGVTKKAAQTYTPGTSNQTISQGQYLNGAQTILGDANLISANIKEGVSIFNILGTFAGSGGGGSSGGGGGLPSGVSALTFGTFTPTSDCTSDWPIYHDLGQTPNFFIFYAKDVYTQPEFAGGCFTQFAMPSRISTNMALYSITFVSSNGTMYQTIGVTSERMTSLSSNLFVADAASNRKLLAGVTYNWICGVIDME